MRADTRSPQAVATIRIRPGVGVCRFPDCTIVLDLRRDRYFRVGSGAGACLVDASKGIEVDQDDPNVREMIRRGLLLSGPSEDDRCEPCAMGRHIDDGRLSPTSSAIEAVDRPAPMDLRALVAGIALPILTRVQLRFTSLESTLLSILRDRRRSPKNAPSIEVLAQRFERVRRLSPVRPRCLPDSLAFLKYAAEYGYRPRLVFGVTAHPFAAHCWVQEADRVLTGALDHALHFHPIMALR